MLLLRQKPVALASSAALASLRFRFWTTLRKNQQVLVADKIIINTCWSQKIMLSDLAYLFKDP